MISVISTIIVHVLYELLHSCFSNFFHDNLLTESCAVKVFDKYVSWKVSVY